VIVGVSGLRWIYADAASAPAFWRLANQGSVGDLVDYAEYPLACPDDGWLRQNRIDPRRERPSLVQMGRYNDQQRLEAAEAQVQAADAQIHAALKAIIATLASLKADYHQTKKNLEGGNPKTDDPASGRP